MGDKTSGPKGNDSQKTNSKKDRRSVERSPSRRRFLRGTILTGGLCASLGVTPSSLANEDRIKYVKYYRHENHEEVKEGERPEKAPVYDRMEKEAWEDIKTAEDGVNKIVEMLNDEFKDKEIGYIYTTQKWIDGGRNGRLQVLYNSVSHMEEEIKPGVTYNEVAEILPDEVKGQAKMKNSSRTAENTFPVVLERDVLSLDNCSGPYYDSDYGEDIPGGAEYNDGSGGCTTATPAYHDINGTRYMLTAGHCAPGGLYNPDSNGTKDGQFEAWVDSGAGDFARVEPKNGANFQYSFSDNSGGYEGDIVGTLSWTAIQSFASNGTTVTKRGHTTGKHSGEVDATGKGGNGYRYYNVEDMVAYGGTQAAPTISIAQGMYILAAFTVDIGETVLIQRPTRAS